MSSAVQASASQVAQAVSQAAPAVSHVAQAVSQAASDSAVNGWFGAPWAFWSGLIGSGITASVAVVTLVLSNRLNLKRQGEQLTHDAEQKREDRKLSIRREVYLSAVEEALALLGAIGGLTQRGIDTTSDSEPLQSFLKATAKIWLVADPVAAHLSRDITTQFSRFFLNSVAASMPARYAMEPVRLREKDIQHWESEAIRFQMQCLDAIGRNAPQEERDRLAELVRTNLTWIEDLKRQKQEATASAMPIVFEAFRATFGELRSVQRGLCKVVSSLRSELDLPPDEEEFLAQLRDMEQEAWKAINKAFRNSPPTPMPEIAYPDGAIA